MHFKKIYVFMNIYLPSSTALMFLTKSQIKKSHGTITRNNHRISVAWHKGLNSGFPSVFCCYTLCSLRRQRACFDPARHHKPCPNLGTTSRISRTRRAVYSRQPPFIIIMATNCRLKSESLCYNRLILSANMHAEKSKIQNSATF